jgi:hypothetical protein
LLARAPTLAVALAAAALLAGCGDEEEGGEPAQEEGSGTLQSGVIDLGLRLEVEQTGGEGGAVVASAQGPFQAAEDGEAPAFDLEVEGAYVNPTSSEPRTNFETRLVSTGDAAYFSYAGEDYEVDPSLFDELVSVGDSSALAELPGLFEGAEAGNGEIEGDPVRRVSGQVDLAAMLKLVNDFLADPGELELESLPEPGSLDGFESLVESTRFVLYVSREDGILRRLDLEATLSGVSVERVHLRLDTRFEQANEPQEIEPPADPKPFAEFLQQPFVFFYASYVGLPEARAYTDCLYEDGAESIYDVEEGDQERCRELLAR